MSSFVDRSLARLRVVAFIYAGVWVATPATFLALVVAEPSFHRLHVKDAGAATGSVALLFVVAFCSILFVSPVFVWALASARRAIDGSGLNPWLLALVHFWFPYMPLGLFMTSAVDAIADENDDGHLPWFLAWAGPVAIAPMSVLTAIFDQPGQDPPGAVVVMGAVLAAYAVTRIVIARRVIRLCSRLSHKTDDVRAAHVEPVSGG